MRLLGKALTFDDVLLVPAFSQVLPRDTRLATRLSRNINLNLPLVSAAMDTVTEARLAIAIAQEGGIGIVHKNMAPKAQAAEVARVKRYESGVLRDPITITLTETAKVFNDRGPRIVIDGGGKVTLSGGGRVRILYQNTCDQAQVWTSDHCQDQDTPALTVQNLTFADGNAKGITAEGGGGGAIFVRGGRLNDPQFGSRMRGEGVFADQVEALFEVACRRAGIAERRPQLSVAAFRVPSSALENRQKMFPF
jgi:hypothetical protein